uniref:Uncharacterized protein n=1 Tax=Anopheles albimanus TaxID=7167 RepID=A0A182F742_ANOAL
MSATNRHHRHPVDSCSPSRATLGKCFINTPPTSLPRPLLGGHSVGAGCGVSSLTMTPTRAMTIADGGQKLKLTILMSLMVIMLRTNRLIRTIAGPSVMMRRRRRKDEILTLNFEVQNYECNNIIVYGRQQQQQQQLCGRARVRLTRYGAKRSKINARPSRLIALGPYATTRQR